MPSLNNTIHSSTIAGQVYYRGTAFYPPEYRRNFVLSTMQNFQMMKQIARFDKRRNP